MNVRTTGLLSELEKSVGELIRIGSEQQVLEILSEFRNASDMKITSLVLDGCMEDLNRILLESASRSSSEGKREIERNSQRNKNIHDLLSEEQAIAIQQVEQIVNKANLQQKEWYRKAPPALTAITAQVNNAAQNEARLTADLIAQSFGYISAGILETQRVQSKHEYAMNRVEQQLLDAQKNV